MKYSLNTLRKYHGSFHEWVQKQKRNHLVNKTYFATKRNQKKPISASEDYPVDFVVTWVDGSDPIWQEERKRYSKNTAENEENTAARFREWGTFRYWFKGVEKYAPWVNCVYLVTYGHVPEWLDTQSPKLKIINHRDFIPEEYLPTFSSHTIEWNLWRIPELSEHFVYFNDDMLLINPVEKNDFFCNGYPEYAAVAQPMRTFGTMGAHRHARMNGYGIMNSFFDIRKCMKEHPEKWFSAKYGDAVKYNRLAYEDGYICGMYFSHLAVPFRKSAIMDFCSHFPDRVHETCMNKFRTNDDIMHQTVQMWEMFNGTFEPVSLSHFGIYMPPTMDNIEETVRRINGPYLMMCANDHLGIADEDFEYIKERILRAYKDKFPDISSFEN